MANKITIKKAYKRRMYNKPTRDDNPNPPTKTKQATAANIHQELPKDGSQTPL